MDGTRGALMTSAPLDKGSTDATAGEQGKTWRVGTLAYTSADTFYTSSFLTAVTSLSGLVLHAKFMALGGPQNYIAPQFGRERNFDSKPSS